MRLIIGRKPWFLGIFRVERAVFPFSIYRGGRLRAQRVTGLGARRTRQQSRDLVVYTTSGRWSIVYFAQNGISINIELIHWEQVYMG